MHQPSRASGPLSRDDQAALIGKHQVGIWRYLRMLGCDSALADDLMQDTFVVVLSKPFEHRSDAETASYLRQAARLLFLKECRRRGRECSTTDLDQIETRWLRWQQPENIDDNDHLKQALHQCLAALQPRARRALALRYGQKQGRDAIARELEMAPSGVKSLLRRARHALESCLRRRVDMEESP